MFQLIQTGFHRVFVATLLAVGAVALLTQVTLAQLPSLTPTQTPPAPQDTENKDAPAAAPPAATAPATTQPAPVQGQQPATARPAQPVQVEDARLLPQDLLRRLDALVPELDRLTKAVDRVKDGDAALERQRDEIETLRTNAVDLRSAFTAPMKAVDEQLRKLGPRPKPPAPAETPAIQAERTRLESAMSQLDAAMKTLALTEERARQLIGQVQTYRNILISRDILMRSPSPMLPSVWREVAKDMPRAVMQVETILSGWGDVLLERYLATASVLFAAFMTYLMLTVVKLRRIPHLVPEPASPEPGTVRRITHASMAASFKVAPVFLAVSLIYACTRLLGLDYQLITPIIDAAYFGFTVAIVTHLVAYAVLMPRHPSWRAVGVTSKAARHLTLLSTLIGIVLGLDILLDVLVRVLFLPPAVGVVKTHLATTAIAGLTGAIGLTGLPEAPGTGAAQRATAVVAKWLRIPLLLLAVVLVGLSVAGYVGLASFISRQTLALMTAGIAFFIAHIALRSAFDARPQAADGSDSGKPAAQMRLIDKTRNSPIGVLLQFTLSTVAAVSIASLLLLSWGFTTADLLSWGRTALFGFKIGDYTISLWRIMIAGLLFAGMLFATRMVQRWLSKVLLVPQRMDAGIAHSIEVGIGYAGTLLAALIGLSYAGLDITNLAIVAGALSVGIGFGLQSIVNNFVSGLILLVERPIKVGDWIVVGAFQGHVRRISVRATEIETFDRSSVIVPNSQLITGTVQNWTLRNAMGRVTIKVQSSYTADPEFVMATIKKALDSCSTVLKFPGPRVAFTDFGASGLDFTVHAYIADVWKGLDAQTELRTAVFNEFRKANIEIPFPQTDIHLRDLDLVRMLSGRAGKEAPAEGSPVMKAMMQPNPMQSMTDPPRSTPTTTVATPDKT